MRKTSEILNVIGTAFLLSIFPQETCSAVTVCASTQTYSALEAVKEHSPTEITSKYAAGEDLEALLAEDNNHCELVISADEKLPVLLVRAGKTSASSMSVLVRAPLILWSADPTLLDNKASAVANKKLKSLALPNAKLTPVGYATSKIVSRKNFPTNYLKGRIYRTEHEYQVLSLVESGNVQAGFLTRPLILDKTGHMRGSFWQTPKELYPELDYYLVILKDAEKKSDVQRLANYLKSNEQVMGDFIKAGFDRPLSQQH